MQKIYFKKTVDLNHQLKELVSISVDESINYKMESQGMRAVGSIMINGEYKDESMKHNFRESIDLDILAQFEKILYKRDFHVKVEDFDYSLNNGDLSLVIQACIYGVTDDEDRIIETAYREKVEEDDEVKEIEKLLRDNEEEMEVVMKSEPLSTVEQIIEEKVVPDLAPVKKEIIEDKQMADIDQDEEDLGAYYLYIVQDGDSYQSIANRYQIDEYQLKNYNHDRSLSKGTIVIVPYHS